MDANSDLIQRRQEAVVPSSPTAFIIYRLQTKTAKKSVFYNVDAWRILSMSNLSDKKKRNAPSPDISAFCSKWRELLDKKLDEQKVAKVAYEGENPGSGFIDILQSNLRQYGVRGIVLASNPPCTPRHEKQYLFTLERVCHDNMNLFRNFRQWGLNQREREIVQMLLKDSSNKEIARALGLSLNTVKGYMKLLTRKLGVTTRTGIIATVLMIKPKHSLERDRYS